MGKLSERKKISDDFKEFSEQGNYGTMKRAGWKMPGMRAGNNDRRRLAQPPYKMESLW